jgi:hypothetical protein
MLAVPVARTTALAFLVGAIVLPASAQAAQYAKFDSVWLTSSNLTPITIHVANDGTRWTNIVPAQARLGVKVDIKLETGSVTSFSLYNGGAPAQESENIYGQSVLDKTKHFSETILTEEINVNRLGNGINSIVSACNARLATGADIREAQPPFTEQVSIGIKARADRNVFKAKPRFKYANGVINVKVVCDAPPSRIALPPPERLPTPPRVSKANLTIVTMDKNAGKHCPRVALLVARFEIDRKGPVNFILRRSDGKAATLVTEETRQLPDGSWRAEYTRKYEFNELVERKYMIEVVKQAKASAWMPMQVRCGDISGGGGLTVGVKPKG